MWLVIQSPKIKHSLLVDKRANFFFMPINTTWKWLTNASDELYITFRKRPHVILMYNVRMCFSHISGNLFVAISYKYPRLDGVFFQKVHSSWPWCSIAFLDVTSWVAWAISSTYYYKWCILVQKRLLWVFSHMYDRWCKVFSLVIMKWSFSNASHI